jgi:hypothetical protein
VTRRWRGCVFHWHLNKSGSLRLDCLS